MKKVLFAIIGFLCSVPVYSQVVRVAIGTKSVGSPELTLKLIARIQALNKFPKNKHDFYDKSIYSPKSVLIYEKNDSGKSRPLQNRKIVDHR
jgi:hypothetical protein